MAGEQPAGDNSPRFLIKGQYVKDLSFENPHAPHSLIALEEKPRIDVSVELKVQRFNEEHFEVTLHLAARAIGKESTLFLLELDYAGIVQIINIPEDKMEMILHIDSAFVLFPFARRVISDVTRDGGFPPLMLEPIDFHALFLQYKQRQQAQASA
jgi:preprotein translocase subunit SecB